MDDIIEVLKMAIEREKESRQHYLEAAQKSTEPETRILLEQLAQDEMEHWKILEAQLSLLAEAEAGPHLKPTEEHHEETEISCEQELEGTKRAFEVLTETKRALEELQRSKEEFYSMVTHDLRSPLISLVAFTKKLLTSLEGKIPEKDYRKLYWIWNEAKRLEEFVNNFLDLTHLTSEKFSLNQQPLNPRVVVNEVIDTLQPQAKERGQHFEVKMQKVPWLNVDEWSIKRLFMNLLSNAIRHGRPEGVIEIGGATEREEEDTMVLFWVKDDGQGIAEKDLPHIFEKFYSHTTSQRGSGLGLTIARQIVEAHGGRIWAESREGAGAIFYFSLPMVKEKNSE